MSETKSTGISGDQLESILARVIAEVRKPPEPTPEQLAQKQMEMDMRRERGQQELQKIERTKLEQKYCTHRHKNGASATACVNKGTPDEFLICVHCQGKIKRAKGPYDEPEQNFIYDENLFWLLRQSESTADFA